MASNKQYNIEIKLNEDAELSTAILFFQKLTILLAKFGVTYFSSAVLFSNYKELARVETSSHMPIAIKEFHETKLQEQSVKMKSMQIDSIDTEVN